MSAAQGGAQTYPCVVGGAIARGRARLFAFLGAVALVMLGLAALTLVQQRWVPALLSLAVVSVAWTAWRMSGDSIPVWLEIHPGELIVQMQRGRSSFPLLEVRARRLSGDEIGHLEGLATHAGGVVSGTGGVESHRLGELKLYLTDLGKAVLVDSGEARLVVSPDDVDGFLGALDSDDPGSR